jgi:hypothetical protein
VLVELRNAAAAKIYSGSVAIKALDTLEQQWLSAARGRIDEATKGATRPIASTGGLIPIGPRSRPTFRASRG